MAEIYQGQLSPREYCTGCSACAAVCKHHAILMKEEGFGFLFPQIDASLCVACGNCTQACPVLYQVNRSANNQPCYAVQAEDDVRMKCSSGGVFFLLARQIFLQGGVVFGAAFDENFYLRHTWVEKEEQLEPLLKSKYTQSDIGASFAQVKDFLQQSRKVLFAGTPCQIAGLKRFLGGCYEGLVTVDVLCLGVPSQSMLRTYLDANVCGGGTLHIEKIDFRDKSHGQGWTSDSGEVWYKEGGEQALPAEINPYAQCFFERISLRESCYECPYATLERVGDLTLGDFWGIEAAIPEMNDNIGTSFVLVNTPEGAALFDAVRPRFKKAMTCSPMISAANPICGGRPAPAARERFLDLYKRYGFMKAAEYAGYNRYDVGIIGCWSVENHGSNLTYYALYHYVRSLGLEPLMIERPRNAPWPPNDSPIGFKASPYRAWDLSPIFSNRDAMRALNKKCDTFLLGSDQLFYHDLYASFGEFIDMSYISDNKRKIAYAASVGRSIFEGTEEQRARLSLFLQRFDDISVRESDGVDVFQKEFGVQALDVLDPVFLCDVEVYRELAKNSDLELPEKYIAVYILDPTPEKEAFLCRVSRELNLPLKVFCDVAKTGEALSSVKWTLPFESTDTNEDWLRTIIESSYVITDSFHGTCFAILFEKPFLSVVNRYRGASRFTSLLDKLELSDRMVFDIQETDAAKIKEAMNYGRAQELLAYEIAKSKEWLNKALRRSKKKALSAYDVLDDRLSGMVSVLEEAHQRGLTSESWLANTHKRIDALERLYGRIDALEGLYQRVDTLEKLYQRVDALEKLYRVIDELAAQNRALQEKVNELTHTPWNRLYLKIKRIINKGETP